MKTLDSERLNNFIVYNSEKELLSVVEYSDDELLNFKHESDENNISDEKTEVSENDTEMSENDTDSEINLMKVKYH